MRIATTLIAIAAVSVLGACGWSYQMVIEDSPATREFALRCFDDANLLIEDIIREGRAERDLSEVEALAMRRLIEIVAAGGTPTDAQYREAGCR